MTEFVLLVVLLNGDCVLRILVHLAFVDMTNVVPMNILNLYSMTCKRHRLFSSTSTTKVFLSQATVTSFSKKNFLRITGVRRYVKH